MSRGDDDSSAWREALSAVESGADAHERARWLVALMTRDEKCSMLDGGAPFWAGLTDLGAGGYHRRPFRAARVERLGVPGFHFSDGPRGSVIGPATAFPVPMARAATFDPELEFEVGSAIGEEIAAAGATLFGGVCVNLVRHLAWGRAQETYGEDPLLLAHMGAAAVRGAQRHVMATVKHFACNSMENARFEVDVTIDLATLLEVYTPHFRACVDAGVACVMSAYNSVNAEWCGQSHQLLDDVLRRRFGFDGFVISDWIFGVRDGVASLRAGLDVEMPYRMVRHGPIVAALDHGEIDDSLVERACERVLATMLRFGVDEPVRRPEALATPAHRELARRVAARSFVLLENKVVKGQQVLPASPDSRVAVIGRLASVANLGDGGSSDVYAPNVVTLAAGVTARFSDVIVDDGADRARAAELARDRDLVVIVVGSTRDDEGEYIGRVPEELTALMPGPDDELAVEQFAAFVDQVDWPPPEGYARRAMGADTGGDRRRLELSDDDRALVEAVGAANARSVLVVMGATGAVLGDLVDLVGAVLFVFYPGLEGGNALGDVLSGDREPAGRLPFAVPRRSDDLVEFDARATRVTYGGLHGQWHLDDRGVAAHYPFGYGLGFEQTHLTGARVHGRTVRVAIDVAGGNDTDVAVFCHVRHADHQRPWRLAGYARGPFAGGAAGSLDVELDLSVLARYDATLDDLVLPGGEIEIEVGRYARDDMALILRADLTDLEG